MLGADDGDVAAGHARRLRRRRAGAHACHRMPDATLASASWQIARRRRVARAAPEVTGPARLGQATKLLVKRLVPGEIAVIDHRDLDRVVGRGPDRGRRVAASSTARRRPRAATRTWGRCCSSRRGSIWSTCPTTSSSTGCATAIASRSRRRGPRRTARSSRAAPLQEPEDVVPPRTIERRREIGEALERFAQNTVEHMLEERELLSGKIELPRFDTDFRDRPALVVVRGVDHQRDLRALRPYIRDVKPVLVGVDGGAERDHRGGLQAGHDRRGHGLRLGGDAALRARSWSCTPTPTAARRAASTSSRSACRYKVVPAPGTSQDMAMLIAAEKGAELIVSVGSQFNLVEFLDKNRRGMSSTFLTRLRIGEILVDAKGVSRLYRPRPGIAPVLLVLAAGVRRSSSRSSPHPACARSPTCCGSSSAAARARSCSGALAPVRDLGAQVAPGDAQDRAAVGAAARQGARRQAERHCPG